MSSARKLTPEHRAAISKALRARGQGSQPKRCPKCGLVKPREMFGVRTNGFSRSRCKKCEASESGVYFSKNRDKQLAYNRKAQLRRSYGMTPDDYEKLSTSQEGMCWICGTTPDPPRRLHVDHCHVTGEIRGLLCNSCNRGLGFFRDNEALLINAVVYLRALRPVI